MAERPEKFPEWAKEDQTDPVSGQVNRSEPPEARKDSGWNRQEIPPRQWLNWLTWKANEWIEWLTGRVDELQTDVDGAQSDADAAQTTADTHIDEEVSDSPHGIGSVAAFEGDQDLRTTDEVGFSEVFLTPQARPLSVELGVILATVIWSPRQSFSSDLLAATSGPGVAAVGVGPAVWRSTDNGNSWTEAQTLTGTIRAMVNTGSEYIAAAGGASDPELWRSTDDGVSWTLEETLGSGAVIGALAHADGVILAGSSSSIFRSTDGGQTWAEVSQDFGETVQALTAGDGVFVAGTGGGSTTGQRLWRSTDGGVTWAEQAELGSVLSLTYGNGVFLAGVGLTLYSSVDGGQSWSSVITASLDIRAVGYGDGLFLAAAGPKLLTSAQGTDFWTERQDFGGSIRAFTYSRGVFVAGTQGTQGRQAWTPGITTP